MSEDYGEQDGFGDISEALRQSLPHPGFSPSQLKTSPLRVKLGLYVQF